MLTKLQIAIARVLAARFVNTTGGGIAYGKREKGEPLTDKEIQTLEIIEREISLRELTKHWPKESDNEL
ncbi:MAG: hypothetical protein KGJ13_11795 [Patescibacteria group bacterium]|nr:hypothetical protein [Patescibacteria group bacterium]